MQVGPRQPVSDLTDQQLVGLSDRRSFERGVDYYHRNRVLTFDDHRTAVTGRVLGSGHIYTTSVAVAADGQVRDDCTCPLGGGCKHVVALVLMARHQRSPAMHTATSVSASVASAGWERLLDDALPAALPGRRRGMALVVQLSRSRYQGPASVTLQPLAEGAKGGWVKTGVGWSDLRYVPSFSQALDTRQLEAVRAIGRAGQGSGHHYYRAAQLVTVGDLGPPWLDLLRAAEQAGVQLLDAQRNGRPVRLHDESGRVRGSVTPPDGGAFGTLAVALERPDLPGASWHDLADDGHETVGWVAETPEGLVLVRAERPLDLPRRRLLGLGVVQIPADDWPRFAMTRLPTVRRLVPLDGDDDLALQPPRLALTVTHHPRHRSDVQLGFAYSYAGGEPVLVPVRHGPEAMRDPDAEEALVARLTPRLGLPALWQRPGELAASASFVGLGVAELVRVIGDVAHDPDVLVLVSGEAAAYAELTDAPAITVSTRGDGDTDWFDLDVSVSVAGESVPLPDLIAALAVGESRLMLESGNWIDLDRPEFVQLASALAEARMLQDKPGDPLRLTPLHAGLWEQLVALGVVGEQSAEWQSRVGALTDVSVRESIEPPAGLDATLRDYQIDGFRWLSTLWDAGLGGVLADDMGLGKTLQVLAVVQRAKEVGGLVDPVLIVCPTTVIGTWLHEAERFSPGLEVRALEATRRKAGTSLGDAIAGADVVVTSFALLRLDDEEFRSREWSALILDEAQFVKNHRSKVYAAARRVPAQRTFALTGTPLENSLMDLWSLLSLAAPGLYPRPDRFKEHYAVPIERLGAVEELAALRQRIRPLMMRRTKEAVATELPPKQETLLHVPLASKHRAIYDRHLQRERQRILGLIDDVDGNRIAILRALTVLRQMSLDPALVDDDYAGAATAAKIEVLVEQLTELAAEGHRALVFSQFTGFLRLVRERLDAEGITYCYLDGRTRRRDEVVRSFRGGDQVAFLISLKAGGFGLTLTEADYVYVLDPWWNPATELQAVDRTHRIGQDKPVNVYRLVSTDTIEEKVVALQQRKRDLFSRVVEDDSAFGGALTADDFRALLEP